MYINSIRIDSEEELRALLYSKETHPNGVSTTDLFVQQAVQTDYPFYIENAEIKDGVFLSGSIYAEGIY